MRLNIKNVMLLVMVFTVTACIFLAISESTLEGVTMPALIINTVALNDNKTTNGSI